MNSLEACIVDYLRDPSNGLQATARVEARRQMRIKLGENVFHARIPGGNKASYALIIKRISTRRFNDLYGESTLAQALIQFTVLGRESPAVVQDICENYLRLALNNYRGDIGKAAIYVHGSTVERDGIPSPGDPFEGSDSWNFVYSMDILFSYNQVGI